MPTKSLEGTCDRRFPHTYKRVKITYMPETDVGCAVFIISLCSPMNSHLFDIEGEWKILYKTVLLYKHFKFSPVFDASPRPECIVHTWSGISKFIYMEPFWRFYYKMRIYFWDKRFLFECPFLAKSCFYF